MTKTCVKCNKTKPIELFFREANNKIDGRRGDCKECSYSRISRWRMANLKQIAKKKREYNKKNYQKIRLSRYKLTVEEYEKMLSIQKGLCALNGCTPPPGRKLVIDHCHTTGKVRGLLCYRCNRDIVILEDRDKLPLALEYLKKYNKIS